MASVGVLAMTEQHGHRRLRRARNIFIHATRYARGIPVVRDSIFVTTVASAPVVIAIVAVLT